MPENRTDLSLNRARGNVSRKLNAFLKFIDKIAPCDTETVLPPTVRTQVQLRLASFEGILSEYHAIHAQIIDIAEEESIEVEETKCSEFEDSYYDALAKATMLLEHVETRSPSSNRSDENVGIPTTSFALTQVAAASQTHSAGSVTNSGPGIDLRQVKLPDITLPTFSGQPSDWLEFREKYHSLIHTNPSINEMQKFHYLRSCLCGDAALIVQGVDFVAAHYEQAWSLVRARYDNMRALVHNHVRSLLSVEPFGRESACKIRGMLDNILKNMGALSKLQLPNTSLCDVVLVHLLTSKFDPITAREWEKSLDMNTLPNLELLKTFLREKAEVLSNLESKRNFENPSKCPPSIKQKPPTMHTHVSTAAQPTPLKCSVCKSNHLLRNCEVLMRLTPPERVTKIKSLNRCINCLRYGHQAHTCSSGACQKCGRRHNTILHVDYPTQANTPVPPPTADADLAPITYTATVTRSHPASLSHKYARVILATAMIHVFDKYNRPHRARALLDSGSQANYITEALALKLGIPLASETIAFAGISQMTSRTNQKCSVRLQAMHSNFDVDMDCIVLPTITEPIPCVQVDRAALNIPAHLTLADPAFHVPGQIDLLLGAEHYFSLMCIGQIPLGRQNPTLQKTKLGWIISGMAAGTHTQVGVRSYHSSVDLSASLSKFWELEDVPDTIRNEANPCEIHFKETIRRDKDGRFIVSIPFHHLDELGDTYDLAMKRFRNVERKLARQPNLRQRYCAFMEEYLRLGHMSPVENNLNRDSLGYYLPHHAVINEGSVSTKLRMVFDGSAKPAYGKSLNECQLTGPVLQEDLFSILVRFRYHNYVIGADIEKMYRQIRVDQGQRKYQQILWRSNPSAAICTYELNTVTYGTASASHLAIRCLMECAAMIEPDLPKIAKIIRRDFYVDDLLTGAETLEEASYLCEQMEAALTPFGFPLRKWISNAPSVVREKCCRTEPTVDLGGDIPSKTLGLHWSAKADTLTYHFKPASTNTFTKRQILSEISKIFDPLGLLAPFVMTAKCLMQRLWREGLGWDESLPLNLHQAWTDFRESFTLLSQISIPRRAVAANMRVIELHGFSDASQVAYGACIFVVTTMENNQRSSLLLTAKGKVAPVKTVTVPRLELCGALLLARLVKRVLTALDGAVNAVDLWSDSTVVLAWLRRCPSTMHTFVANRVAKIQALVSDLPWGHVPTADNPADLISRGSPLPQLMQSDMWWCGPHWLTDPSSWPNNCTLPEDLPEIRSMQPLTINSTIKPPIINIEKFSSLKILCRSMAYVLRFIANARAPVNLRTRGSLSLNELQAAEIQLVKCVQQSAFPEEIRTLQAKRSLPTRSSLLQLCPFLDEEGILRVGGRLRLSEQPHDAKHPILLPKSCRFTTLIFCDQHERLLHAGPQALVYSVRQRYWPLSARSLARKIVHACVTCSRAKPLPFSPPLGQLPAHRVSPSMPFAHCGIDYAGPFRHKPMYLSGSKTYKAYVAVFVCMSTKAIHLELVTDLSTAGFMAALRRFISRRGLPLTIYSDNGTNFVGANSQLRELFTFLRESADSIQGAAADINIQWKFIPARSPHFGGIWEAGVKSMKHHLSRVIGEQLFSYEHYLTLLTQIEAILNSRPISTMSSDPNDSLPLCPAHFLIGRPLHCLPDNANVNVSLSSKFKLLQTLREHFWKKWSNSYLRELQQGQRWTGRETRIPKVDDVVLLVDDNLRPCQWRLGRIIKLHPGKDGVARVATLRTQHGETQRAVRRLAPLPIAVEKE